ncbi:conserved hypothetical protein [Neospora caninum Liverpool]|uniref:Transmembrane protein n=1 Tax=Neospora caninum (strain Liverpool) TaxID=572307 RepID=F0VN55_NEOCL|nr:conserved hypothetical protein [Neospora caninum Liverpool]CBZ55151.1 conserved hypothetical protein [Neospora caninum Liverpool]CEL69877.1 TPA: hypothetical protein BN1204_055760 [Neospora caninum Liverpool]|eukprot:XP_003885179.1 conserved hypothetical protein [Neospora caninum Liverpool]
MVPPGSSRSFRLCLSSHVSRQALLFFTLSALPFFLCLSSLTPGLPLPVQALPPRSRLRHSSGHLESPSLSPSARIFLETSEPYDSPEDDLLEDGDDLELSGLADDAYRTAGGIRGTAGSGGDPADADVTALPGPVLPASDAGTETTPPNDVSAFPSRSLPTEDGSQDINNLDAKADALSGIGSDGKLNDYDIDLGPTAYEKIKMSQEIARGAAEEAIPSGPENTPSVESDGDVSEGVGGQAKEKAKSSNSLEKEVALPEAAEGSPCTKASVETRLKEIGCPLQLTNKHFALDYKQGVRIKGREFREERASKVAYVPQAVSEAPSYEPLAGIVLVADIDEPGIGSDVRLLHLVVRPSVCEEKGAERCTIPYLLPPVPVAEPAHRIVALGFDSPTGKRFKITEVLKLIQQKPQDVDLRRVSLSRLIEENAEFFRVNTGTTASPSWNVFKVYNAGQAVSSGEGSKALSAVDVPSNEVSKDAGSEKQATETAEAHETEGDGATKPEFGGYSPGSGGQLKPSTIFGYVLGSLLVIAVFVGIVVVTSDCVSGATKS